MAQSNSTVNILQVCKVAPPPSASIDSATPKSVPLTFFDILWLRLPPVQRLFFYEFTNATTTSFFHSDILPRLKHSLSLTLQHFLPLAGNLIWPKTSHKPVIVYAEGDAVTLTVAESDADFYRLSGANEVFGAREYHPLVPDLATSHERAAVLALQVTLFPKSGFSIGMAMHHAVLDGKSVHMFVKSWALTCRSLGSPGQPPELQPLYDRTVIEDPAGLEAIYTKQLLDLDHGPDNRSLMYWKFNEVSSDSVRGTFHLTRARIEKLKQLVIINEQLHTSTYCVTCAYIWVCLVKAEEINEDKTMLVINVDCRSDRLEPPVPLNYFGNCVANKFVVTETKGLVEKDGLVLAVKAIGEAIKSLETNGALTGAEDWALTLMMSSNSDSSTTTPASRVYSTAGSPRFEVYNTDFGWGKPRKTDVVSIDRTGAISLSDTRNGDEVEIGLVLKKHHMEAFSSLFSQGLGMI
ncbi:Transferase [Trema orientale]|uniref:Transferase n=1 Tax=Trema orientale TaxID=63057 RepID=A0A2P5DK08_TREOI|nr:Transferase [Trema orientale]